jgi:hypothetical protein
LKVAPNFFGWVCLFVGFIIGVISFFIYGQTGMQTIPRSDPEQVRQCHRWLMCRPTFECNWRAPAMRRRCGIRPPRNDVADRSIPCWNILYTCLRRPRELKLLCRRGLMQYRGWFCGEDDRVVDAAVESEPTSVIDPAAVLASLLAKGGRSLRQGNLAKLHEIFRKQHKAGCGDFALPAIGQLFETQGVLKGRALFCRGLREWRAAGSG